MIDVLKSWMHKNFSHPEAILLIILLSLAIGIMSAFGNILAPVIASIVISYMLSWIVKRLELYMPRYSSVMITYIIFISIFLSAIFFLLPILWHQLTKLFNDLPSMVTKSEAILISMADKLPDYISKEDFIATIKNLMPKNDAAREWGKFLLKASIASIPGVITWCVYLVLVPVLVFFFLKDQKLILEWSASFLPKDRSFLNKVWNEVDEQISKYILGKVTEFAIVALATYIGFIIFKLNYSALLAFLVGISVLIPYVGAIAVTIPVAIVGYMQFGFTPTYAYMLTTYAVIQALDGSVLVPLLFSEAVNMHPIAIVIAILFFGAIWGFWGVFFAIPLATVVKAIIYSWPTKNS